MTTQAAYREHLDQLEAKFQYDTEYLRTILDKHPDAFATFADFIPLSQLRRDLPLDAFFVAKLTAMKIADCSACLELNIKMAIDAGLDKDLVKAIVEEGELNEELAQVRAYTKQVATHRSVAPEDVETLREFYGTTACIELAFAIASVGVFPLIKRAMGLATSCANITMVYG